MPETIMPDAPLPEKMISGLPNRPDEEEIWQVSDLAAALKGVVEEAFSSVRLRAEIGRVSRPASGHIYLDLKDERAVLNGVIWRQQVASLATAPEEGLEVICRGRLTTFPAQSRYQLILESMAAAGEGALMALLARRRKKLFAEGLFDAARKKALPFAPEVIGIITSPSGAVIRDMLHRLGERWPCRVLVWPVRVQGEHAASEVRAAIEGFNRSSPEHLPRPDLLIVARGGGALEDFMPFNDEALVRAAAASAIPLVSAIGHETDHTLLDEAADMRAPTPTAAAELASPVLDELRRRFAEAATRMGKAARGRAEAEAHRLRTLMRILSRGAEPARFAEQQFDAVCARLAGSRRQSGVFWTARLREITAPLTYLQLQRRVAQRADDVEAARRRAARAIAQQIAGGETGATALFTLLRSLDYRRILERGFVLARGLDGRILRRAREALHAGKFEIEFAAGEKLPAQIRRSGKAEKKQTPDQGRLL